MYIIIWVILSVYYMSTNVRLINTLLAIKLCDSSFLGKNLDLDLISTCIGFGLIFFFVHYKVVC